MAIEVWKDTQLNHDTKGNKKRMCHALFLFWQPTQILVIILLREVLYWSRLCFLSFSITWPSLLSKGGAAFHHCWLFHGDIFFYFVIPY